MQAGCESNREEFLITPQNCGVVKTWYSDFK